MIAEFVILFIIICVIAGFCGMPFLFIFPVIIVVFIIAAILYSKGNNLNKKVEKKDEVDNTLE